MSRIKLNQVIFSGFVPRDCDIHQTQNGTKGIMTLTVGIDDSYKHNDQWVNKTSWINVKLFANIDRLNAIANNVHKGVNVIVSGRLNQNQYKDKSGNMVYTTEVIASSIQAINQQDNANVQPSEAVANNAQDSVPVEYSGDLNLDFLNEESPY